MALPLLDTQRQVELIRSGAYSQKPKIHLPTSVRPTMRNQVQRPQTQVQTPQKQSDTYYSRNNPKPEDVFIKNISFQYDRHIAPHLQSADSIISGIMPFIPVIGPSLAASRIGSQKAADALKDLSKHDLPGFTPHIPQVGPATPKVNPGWNTSRAVGYVGNVIENLGRESRTPLNTVASHGLAGVVGAGAMVYNSPKYLNTAINNPSTIGPAVENIAMQTVRSFETNPAGTAIEFYTGGKVLGKAGSLAGKGADSVGIATGIRRTKVFPYKEPPHHPTASQSWQIEQLLGQDTIHGARGTIQTPKGVVDRILGKEEQWTRSYNEGRSTFGFEGQYVTISPKYRGSPAVHEVGQYFIDKGTGANIPIIGPALRVARGRVHEVEIPTVASEFTKAERNAIYSEWGQTGQLSKSTYADLIERAGQKSMRIDQPVATLTPKHAQGSPKPELEAMMIFGSEASKRITSSRFMGLTDTGVAIREVAFGSQKPSPKNNPFFVENIRYNLNRKEHYTQAASVRINRYLDEMTGRAMTKPGGQFGPHGAGHYKAVESELLGLRQKSPTIREAVTPDEAKTAAFVHDAYRIYGGETELLPHADAVSLSMKGGYITHPAIRGHSAKSLDKISGMVGQHTRIKPGLSIEGLKTKAIFRPNVAEKAFASADRSARAAEAGFVKSGQIFPIPEKTIGFQIKQLGRDSVTRWDNIVSGREPVPIGFRTEYVAKPYPGMNAINRPVKTPKKSDSYYNPGKGYNLKGLGVFGYGKNYSNKSRKTPGYNNPLKSETYGYQDNSYTEGYNPIGSYTQSYRDGRNYQKPYRTDGYGGQYQGKGYTRRPAVNPYTPKPPANPPYAGTSITHITTTTFRPLKKSRPRGKKQRGTFGDFAFSEFLTNMPVNEFLGVK